MGKNREKEEERYLTLGGRGEGIFRDRGSRFLGYAFPVKNEKAFQEELQRLRKEHHGARHHCWAYRLSPDSGQFRYNDDGEPSGTAGRPIYEQILSAGVHDTAVVVVRYFGGILLGTGGLHNAYKQAAAEALRNAPKKEKVIEGKLEILFPYDLLNNIMQLIDRERLHISEQTFTDSCRILLTLPRSKVPLVAERLKRLGKVEVRID